MADIDEVGLRATLDGAAAYIAQAQKMTAANTAMTSSLDRAVAASGRFQQAMGAAIRRGALIGGAAVVGLAAVSVKSFISFDQAMNQSLAIMGDLSDSMKDELSSAAREMAKTTTFSATQAAESYFFLASAGLNAEQSLAALPVVAKFGQAGMFDMATATDLLTDAQSALGLVTGNTAKDVENMTRVSDVLVKANTKANATVEQFATALTREAGAALKSLNKDVEEGIAVLAAFADQGVKGEIAGTALSRIIRLMGSAAKNNAEAYEQLNVAVFDSEGKFRNFADIVEDLEGALLGLSDAERVAALEALGFQARVQGVILPLLGTSDAIREYEANARNAKGITEEIAEKQLKSFGAQLSLIKSRLEDLAITIGKELTPPLVEFLGNVTDAAEKYLPGFVDELRDWKPVISETGQVLTSLGKTVEEVFQFVINNAAALTVAIIGIGAAFAWATPGGAILVGLGAIVAAIALFNTSVEDLSGSSLAARQQAEETKKKFLEFGDTLQDFFENYIKPLSPAFTSLGLVLDAAGVEVYDFDKAIGSSNHTIEQLKQRVVALKLGFEDYNKLLPNLISDQEHFNRVAEAYAGGAKIAIDRTFAAAGAIKDFKGEVEAATGTTLSNADAIGVLISAIENQNYETLNAGQILRYAAAAGIDLANAANILAAAESAATTTVIKLGNATLSTAQAFSIARAEAINFARTIGDLAGLRLFELGPQDANLDPAKLQTLLDSLENALRPIDIPVTPQISLPPGFGEDLTGAVGSAADSAEEALQQRWQEFGAGIADGISVGLQTGAVDLQDALQDALNFAVQIPVGVEGALDPIIAAIEAEANAMETVGRVTEAAVERGFVQVQDVLELLRAGQLEAAQEFFETLEGGATDLQRDIARAAQERAEDAAREFFDRFTQEFQRLAESVVGDILSIVPDLQGFLGTLSSAPSVESAQADAEIAKLRLHEFDLLEQAAQEQEKRLGVIRNMERDISKIRESSAQRIEQIESQIDNVRASEERQLRSIDNRIEAIRDGETAQLDELSKRSDALRGDELVFQEQLTEAAERRRNAEKELADLQRRSEQQNAYITPITLRNRLAAAQAEVDASATAEQHFNDELDRLDAEQDALKKQGDQIKSNNDARIDALEDERDLIKGSSDAIIEQMERQIEAEKKAADKRIESIQRAIEATEKQRGPAEKLLQNIRDQITELENLNQRRQLERDILKAMGVLADQTLKTEAEILKSMVATVLLIEEASGEVDVLTEGLLDLLEDVEDGLPPAKAAARLLQLGMHDLAREFLKASAHGINLLNYLRDALKGLGLLPPTASFQEGGYIPAGVVTRAVLHGPEVVVPVGGGNTEMLGQLAAALGGVGGAGGGFRNYGTQNFYDLPTLNDPAFKAIQAALGGR